MSKKLSRIIGLAMLAIGVVFVVVALMNPQLSFPFPNEIAYAIYIGYLVIAGLFIVAPFASRVED